MTAKKPVYVVMRKSGRVMSPTGLTAGTHWEGPLFSIYSAIAQESGQSNSDYDPPDRLFLDGKLVVEGGLYNMAHRYVSDMREAEEYARRQVCREHQHPWMPDDEMTGSNPPGVDKWIVKRARG